MTDNGAGDEDPDVGEVCVSGLALGDYTVNEVTPPPGYGDAAHTDLTVTVVDDTNCTDSQPTGAGAVTFTNAPLGDIQVNFRDGGSGEISATSITCDNTGTTADTNAGHRLGRVGDARTRRKRREETARGPARPAPLRVSTALGSARHADAPVSGLDRRLAVMRGSSSNVGGQP